MSVARVTELSCTSNESFEDAMSGMIATRRRVIDWLETLPEVEKDKIGAYGVSLGGMFYGESMFANAPDSSKVAFVILMRHLVQHGIELVDCQQETEHLARFGAEPWDRARFVAEVHRLVQKETYLGPWRL